MDFFAAVNTWVNNFLTSDSLLMTLLVAPFVFFLEWKWPLRPTPGKHYLFGITYWLANLCLLTILLPITGIATAMAVQKLGLGIIDLSALGFSGLAGAAIAVLVSTFITDFFFYWFHRTMHKTPVLWPVHMLHHSDEHMTLMTANRGHLTESLLAPLFVTIPMAVLFELPPVTIGVLSLVPYAYQFFAHANLNVSFGPLWWLLISPNYHRIHHSIEPRHRDKNFTNWFPIWDIIFGSVYVPESDELPETGVDGVEVRTLSDAFLLPVYAWRDMFNARRKRTRSQ